jgi:trans-2,3-dihydro-3-hydroxyanthranilate isomerase
MVLDSFTQTTYGGNPCAVVFDADSLEPWQMQIMAREMNLSETVFVMNSSIADVRLRFFSVAMELPMAGHPTIAAVAGLLSHNARSERRLLVMNVETQAGLIPVAVDATGALPDITMTQPAPIFLRSYPNAEVAYTFGLQPTDLLDACPCQTVSTGAPMLMVAVASIAALKEAKPDRYRFRTLQESGDFLSAHLFVCEGFDEKGDTYARHFVLPPDPLEDPFTGSATGAMAAYAWQYQLLQRRAFIAQQGHSMGRPGQAQVSLQFEGDVITGVRVGGSARRVIKGVIAIPSATLAFS